MLSALVTRAVEAAPLPAPAATFDFVRDVQPILEGACLGCHGPEKQKGGVRLDSRAALIAGTKDGPIVVLGHSADSVLIKAVARVDKDLEMPPDDGAALSPAQVSTLRAWIDAGAPYPAEVTLTAKTANTGAASAPARPDPRAHWAWRPPTRPAVPEAAAWGRTPVDGFVLARLRREGLAPSAEADKVTLLRRLHFDLVGLPPTPDEVARFLADKAPDAYDREVERLLASPHFGERWARHWLDVARYADTDGFEKDKRRFMWPYRDYVISAFNRDMPYDRFLVEQLAGDLLPRPTPDQLVATGFLRNSMVNEEGGADPEQFRVEAMFDRMDALGRAVLGVTLQCAQCHTHKFDPISHEEYYRLFAFLNDTNDAQPGLYFGAAEATRLDVLRRVAAAEATLRARTPDLAAKMAAWEAQLARRPHPRWTSLQGTFDDESVGGAKYLPQKDGSYLVQSYAPTHSAPKMTVTVPLRVVRGVQLELLTDPSLPLRGPGRSTKGMPVLTDIEVEIAPADAPDKRRKVKLGAAFADYEQAEAPVGAEFPPDKDPTKVDNRVVGPVRFAIDGKGETGWGIDAGPGRRNVDRAAVFLPEAPAEGGAAGSVLTITLKQNHGGWNSDDLQSNMIGRYRISVTGDDVAAAPPLEPRLAALLAVPPARRTPAQVAEIFSRYRRTVPQWRRANEAIDALWAGHPEPALGMALEARAEARPTFLLKRGDWLQPGRAVTPGVPAAFNPLPAGAPPTRLGLARWITDRKAPTTARAIVNRLWQAYFGTGLVASSEDLGAQSEPPSHPELLDWLAVELQDHGHSLKHIHRLIVRSATYRQSSRVSETLLARDPANRWLARGPRLRVEAEVVRDVFLSASGLLDERVGGPSVMPPAPAFIFMPPASYAPFPWIDAGGSERYRRALYTFRRRTTPYPMLQTFDAPTGEASCSRRVRSNTPLQALVTLNEGLSMEAAQALGRRMAERAGAPAERLEHGFRRVLSRAPQPEELTALEALLIKQRQRLQEGWLDPWQITTGKGDRPQVAGGTSPTELAAYTLVARVLLNLDEAITKE